MVVDADLLTKIEATLKRSVAKATIGVTCSDNTDHEFTSVSTLLKYENPKGSHIEAVRFRARADDWKKEATVSLTNYSFRTFEIEVRGTQATATKTRDELTIIIHGSKAWYWPLYKVDFVLLFGSAFFALWLVANIVLRIQHQSLVIPNSGSDQSLGVLFGVAVIATGMVIEFFRNRLFPRIQFAVGQGAKRHRLLEKIQWGVVISFLVSLSVAVVVHLVTRNG